MRHALFELADKCAGGGHPLYVDGLVYVFPLVPLKIRDGEGDQIAHSKFLLYRSSLIWRRFSQGMILTLAGSRW